MGKIVIIGGGVAGLSAGITAAMAGHAVTVCEKNRIPGGNLIGWDRRGYHIDNCIHWLTGTNPKTKLYKKWESLGVYSGTEIYQPGVLYTAEYGKKSLSLHSSLEKTEEALLMASEGDEKRIRSLIRAVRAMNIISGTEDFTPKSLPCFFSLARHLNLSVKDLADTFNSRLIKSFISSFFGEDFGALALINVISTFTSGNGALPKGGSTAMASAMAKKLESVGGTLLLGSEVTAMEAEGGVVRSVRLRDGRTLCCDALIIACDPHAVSRFIPLVLPAVLSERYRTLNTFSSHHTAFALDLGRAPFSSTLILDIPEKYRKTLGSDKLILREFSHEPSFSPRGKSLIEATVFVRSDFAKKFIEKRHASLDAYRAYKNKLSDIISHLITARFPELSGKISKIDSWTPATYERYLGARDGSYMSFILPKSYIPKKCKSKLPGYRNLFLASQWQTMPGGLPMSAECGISTATEVILSISKSEKEKGRLTAQ